MTKWFWLSFADGELPKGEQFLGVCILQAEDLVGAAKLAWALEINPGGEVASVELPFTPDPRFCNRLLDKREASLAAKFPWETQQA